MKFSFSAIIEVDKDANFIEADDSTMLEVMQDLLTDALHQIDDTKILDLEVVYDH